jgi:DNA-binding transcriptional LysR family regulator
MLKKIDWDSQIGRRLRLRDLRVFLTVAERGSMSKAAAQLGVSTPTVSEVIADLEHGLGVRLLDRSPKGVEPTGYGHALLKRTLIVFDELKQCIKDMEFLDDPTSGELRIGCPEAIAAILPPILESFSHEYPRVVMLVEQVSTTTLVLPGLRERTFDLVLGRLSTPIMGDSLADDLNIEILFDDQLVVAAGMRNRWARRRKIDLAELVNESWVLAASDSWNHRILSEAFQARGMAMPKITVRTFSVHIRIDLLASGRFITALPKSLVDHCSLKVLPVDLPNRPWPVTAITVKNRTLSPVVERFIEHVRNFGRATSEGRLSPIREIQGRRIGDEVKK